MKAHTPRLAFVSALVFAAACGASEPTDTTAPATQAAPAPVAPAGTAAEAPADNAAEAPADTAAEAPADTAAEARAADPADSKMAPAASFEVHVVKSSRGKSGPASGPVALTATPATNSVDIALSNYTSYCEPAPSFTAAADGQALVVTVDKPTQPVSKCFAPYTLSLQIELPGRNNLREVVLVKSDGAELARAPIATASK